MDEEALEQTTARQDGLVSRRQVHAAGGTDDDIARMLRRRRWARVHEGVYVDHTGPLTWEQRAWAAVLVHGPAALGGASALRAHGLRADEPDDGPIEVVVDRSRRVDDPPGVLSRQVRRFDQVAYLQLSPPRVRLEPAVLSVASRARTEDAAVAVIADAVQQRRTTPARLAATLETLPRLPRRRVLLEVLADVATGAYSALECRYLAQVERRHGLPAGGRQVRVEAATDRWADLGRDVDALVGGGPAADRVASGARSLPVGRRGRVGARRAWLDGHAQVVQTRLHSRTARIACTGCG